MYVIGPEIKVPKPLTNTFLPPVTAYVHPLLGAHVNMLWSPVRDPPARQGIAVSAPWAWWRAGEEQSWL